MDNSDLFAVLDIQERPKTKSRKRKWREIEAIKDKFKLEKELAEYDSFYDAELDNLER